MMQKISETYLQYFNSGTPSVRIYWRKKGKYHRDNRKPAIIEVNNKYKFINKFYYLNNNRFCIDDQPTYVRYGFSGKIMYMSWEQTQGVNENMIYIRHRNFGPLDITLDDNEVIYYAEWFIHGQNKTTEILKWIAKNNIELTKNYTIPDEYKAEFKLLFH